MFRHNHLAILVEDRECEKESLRRITLHRDAFKCGNHINPFASEIFRGVGQRDTLNR